jgi:predicted DNA-binding transcriptional regulator YafY
MTVEEADKLSFRAFRLDRILSLRYGQKELG